MSSESRDPLRSISDELNERARQIAFEIVFFENLARIDPANVRVLVALAENYSTVGEYEKSLPIDRQLTLLRPEKSVFWYNLACSQAQLRDADSAFVSLEKAIAFGYDDVVHLVKDPDLKPIRSDPRFSAIYRSCKKRRIQSRLEACRKQSESAE